MKVVSSVHVFNQPVQLISSLWVCTYTGHGDAIVEFPDGVEGADHEGVTDDGVEGGAGSDQDGGRSHS